MALARLLVDLKLAASLLMLSGFSLLAFRRLESTAVFLPSGPRRFTFTFTFYRFDTAVSLKLPTLVQEHVKMAECGVNGPCERALPNNNVTEI